MKKWYAYVLSVVLLIVVVGVVLLRILSTSSPRALSCHTWKNVPVPQNNQSLYLSSISLLSVNDVWMGGMYYQAASKTQGPLVEHWDGRRWQSLFPQPFGKVGDEVDGIAAISDSDIWVAGYSYTTPGTVAALIEHWNGRTWYRFPDPSGNSGFSQLTGIIALADGDVWAVGYTDTRDFTQTLIVHWDGTALKRVASPNVADENNELNGISALSENDIWAVGSSKGYEGPQLTLTEHWDGSRWSTISSPDPSLSENALASVAAASTNDIWAVGAMLPNETARASTGGYHWVADRPYIQTNGLILHWDGQRWQTSTFPRLGQHQVIWSVTAYSSRDVWAAGFFIVDTSQGQIYHGLVLHWDGSAWQNSQIAGVDYINAIGTSSTGGLWSAGFTVAGQSSSNQQAIAESCT